MASRILTAAALFVALAGPALAQQADLRAHAYRIASAEQMIDRLNGKLTRAQALCNAECNAAVQRARIVLPTIREIAERDDPVVWANLVDSIHAAEREIDGPLYWAEHNK